MQKFADCGIKLKSKLTRFDLINVFWAMVTTLSFTETGEIDDVLALFNFIKNFQFETKYRILIWSNFWNIFGTEHHCKLFNRLA